MFTKWELTRTFIIMIASLYPDCSFAHCCPSKKPSRTRAMFTCTQCLYHLFIHCAHLVLSVFCFVLSVPSYPCPLIVCTFLTCALSTRPASPLFVSGLYSHLTVAHDMQVPVECINYIHIFNLLL